jgi:hypothetical protein
MQSILFIPIVKFITHNLFATIFAGKNMTIIFGVENPLEQWQQWVFESNVETRSVLSHSRHFFLYLIYKLLYWIYYFLQYQDTSLTDQSNVT